VWPFLVVVWLVTGVLWCVFEHDIWETTGFHIFSPVWWCLLAAGTALTLAALRWVMPDRKHRLPATVALLIAVSGLALLFFGRSFLSMDVRFQLSMSHYERRVAEVLAGRRTKATDIAGIERGPPDRVAFYWKRGVTDNWVGLVYDPTGDVVNAAACQDFFGGTMTHSRHLTGPWFICWFT